MKYLVLHFSIAFVALCATTLASPVLAVQDTFSGGAPAADPRSVVGEDGTGNVWQTHTDAYGENSNFAMSDFYSSPQPFNPDDISSGSGTFATSFQLTLDSSESGSGVAGITQDAIRSGLTNHLIVIGDFSDTSTWTIWDITYGMLDADSGLFQQITFTAPLGTQLSQGVDFSLNVNFAGIMTSDFGLDGVVLTTAPQSVLAHSTRYRSARYPSLRVSAC